MSTLRLIHPEHGVIRDREFRGYCDSKKVLRCVELWRHTLGRIYLPCECLWDKEITTTNKQFVSLLKKHYDIVD